MSLIFSQLDLNNWYNMCNSGVVEKSFFRNLVMHELTKGFHQLHVFLAKKKILSVLPKPFPVGLRCHLHQLRSWSATRAAWFCLKKKDSILGLFYLRAFWDFYFSICLGFGDFWPFRPFRKYIIIFFLGFLIKSKAA